MLLFPSTCGRVSNIFYHVEVEFVWLISLHRNYADIETRLQGSVLSEEWQRIMW